jgi:protein TonB
VDSSGNVTNATFESPGPSKYFARKAMEAAQQWKFKPAQNNGQPVPREWTLRFQFKRSGTNVIPLPTAH